MAYDSEQVPIWPAGLDTWGLLVVLLMLLAAFLIAVIYVKRIIFQKQRSLGVVLGLIVSLLSVVVMWNCAIAETYLVKPDGVHVLCGPPGNAYAVAFIKSADKDEALDEVWTQCRSKARTSTVVALGVWSLSTGLYVRSRRAARKSA